MFITLLRKNYWTDLDGIWHRDYSLEYHMSPIIKILFLWVMFELYAATGKNYEVLTYFTDSDRLS